MSKRVLIVDDEESVRSSLEKLLAYEKYITFSASDGESALRIVTGERVDIVLLDIKMPRIDGFQILKRLKGDSKFNFIPVVMLTSSKDEQDVVNSYRSGAAGFIPKPVGYDEFLKVVDSFNYYWQVINKLPNPDMCT